jgi:A/G-specific adenine glycosylase
MNNASFFRTRFLKWYKTNARDLPWRRTRDPYKIWISEIMLQQTTVNAVIPFYERWIKELPTVYNVANASPEKLLKMWQGLGYYSRVRNIHKAAQIICNDYGGKIPDSAEEISKLPGFGPYTTGAVLSIAFNKRHPLIDANVRRVFMRILAMQETADKRTDEKILTFLHEILPHDALGDFNQSLMEIGALICRSREPICIQCPVNQRCQAYEMGIQEIIPAPKVKNITPINAVIAIIQRDKKYFIQKRPSKGLLADMWEFPGGKIEKGEKPDQALKREVKEEIGKTVTRSNYLFKVNHTYTQFKVTLQVFRVLLNEWPKPDATHKWVSRAEFARYPMPSGSARIIEKLLEKSEA